MIWTMCANFPYVETNLNSALSNGKITIGKYYRKDNMDYT